MIKKWYWHLHLPDSYARFGHLPSCFTCERTIASFASRLLKTQSFEAHLLEQLLANEICVLKEPNVFPAVAHLVKEKKATAKEIAAMAPFMSQQCSTAKISSVAKLFRGIQIHSGDAIMYSNGDGLSSWKVAQDLFHAYVFGMATTLVEMWTIEALEKHHAKCHTGSSLAWFPSAVFCFQCHTPRIKTRQQPLCCYLTKSIAKLEKMLLLTCSMSLQQKLLSYPCFLFKNKASEHEKNTFVSMV